MPSRRKPIQQVAPCPCGKNTCERGTQNSRGIWRVLSDCGWRGPMALTEAKAIELWNTWNRHSDVEAKLRSVAKGWEDRSVAQGKIIDKLIKERDEAERRGARKVLEELRDHAAEMADAYESEGWEEGAEACSYFSRFASLKLSTGKAIARGKVLPAKKKGARKQ